MMGNKINPVRNTKVYKENKISNRVKIRAGAIEMEAELNNSKTSKLIWDALPINASCNRWGDEIYFYVSIKTGLENPKELVQLGDIAYWPEGPALCIFFGPTPISRGKEIRPASAVNIIGKLAGNPEEFRRVLEGEKIVLEKI